MYDWYYFVFFQKGGLAECSDRKMVALLTQGSEFGYLKPLIKSQEWWHAPLIPELGR